MSDTTDPFEEIKNLSTGQYLQKFNSGDTKIRILTPKESIIIGTVAWIHKDHTDDGNPKPKRFRPEEKVEMLPEYESLKTFRSMVVWNYEEKSLQVFNCEKPTIWNPIAAYARNKKWGNPDGYDIVINRKGESFSTAYSIIAEPHSEIEKEIKEQYEASNINLEALYWSEEFPYGGDPFQAEVSTDSTKKMSEIKDKSGTKAGNLPF